MVYLVVIDDFRRLYTQVITKINYIDRFYENYCQPLQYAASL